MQMDHDMLLFFFLSVFAFVFTWDLFCFFVIFSDGLAKFSLILVDVFFLF